jgi:hypothetical protein
VFFCSFVNGRERLYQGQGVKSTPRSFLLETFPPESFARDQD